MRKFWIDCVLATAFVFLLMWGFVGLTQLNVFNAFDPIGEALSDVELTDYVFSRLREDPDVDQNIVLVNIGNLSRRGIAEQVQIISKYKPKVIGIDAFFDCPKGEIPFHAQLYAIHLETLCSSSAIQEAGNVVLVSKVLRSDTLLPESTYDSLRRSDPMFRDNAVREGFASLDSDAKFQDDVKICRFFNPVIPIKGKNHYAFGVELAMSYDSIKTKKFLDRNTYLEIINYRGNVVDMHGTTNYPQMFFTIDVDDVLTGNFDSELFKDKIVILGYLGQYLGDPSWQDRFFTPLNIKLAGKANPDMFGVVVHANIVSMILNEDFVDQMAEWQEVLMAIIICLLNVALFSIINTKLPLWYDGITKLLQLIQLLLYTVLMVFIFHWYSFKLNVTLTLAAVALVGDVFEVYMSVIKNLYYKIKGWFTITPKDESVLTPVNPEES